ncbi:MAG TPA: hypothetical protein PKY96_01620 [Flavobacteriales bacterium]|nr:hypothetical protein [Flavobacteriales bacterium]
MRALSFGFLLATITCAAQDGVFHILHNDKVLGTIDALRVAKGDSVTYSMISQSSFTFLWKRRLRTVARTLHVAGRVTNCLTTVHDGDALRDSSALRCIGGRGLYVVHPGKVYAGDLPTNPWSTARLYYDEPVGQDSIFVESELVECAIERVSPGEYILRLPNNEHNHYVYRNGILQEIRVDRGWLGLVFRRVV